MGFLSKALAATVRAAAVPATVIVDVAMLIPDSVDRPMDPPMQRTRKNLSRAARDAEEAIEDLEA